MLSHYAADSMERPSKPNTRKIMLCVMLALVPGTLVYALLFSTGVLINVFAGIVFAVCLESLILSSRKTSTNLNRAAAATDGSIALAAFLLALAVPPLLPLWQLATGILVMVLLGKHVYGGIGQNPFNPAMVGYCALMVSFPQTMTFWPSPDFATGLGIVETIKFKIHLSAVLPDSHSTWDSITQATPLEYARNLRLTSVSGNTSEFTNLMHLQGWVWINIAFLAGGVYLMYKRIIQWHIPVGVLATLAVLSLLFAHEPYPVHYSLLAGATVLGAFFIATDPVTTASSMGGRLVFAFGVGVLTFVIREYGGYPEGIAFAILLMNLCVPLIDYVHMHSQRQR